MTDPLEEIPPGWFAFTVPVALRRILARRSEAVRVRMGEISDDPFAFLSLAPVDRPSDPALLRLLPDAVGHPDGEDPTDRLASDERRRMTDADLRGRKISDAEHLQGQLLQDGENVVLSERDIEIWLRALNDARLLVAGDLGVTTTESHAALLRTLRKRSAANLVTVQALDDLELLGRVQTVLLDALEPELVDEIERLMEARPWLQGPSVTA